MFRLEVTIVRQTFQYMDMGKHTNISNNVKFATCFDYK